MTHDPYAALAELVRLAETGWPDIMTEQAAWAAARAALAQRAKPVAPMLQEQPSGDAWSDGYEAGYKAGLAEHDAPPAPQAQRAEPAGVVGTQIGGIHHTVWDGKNVRTGVSKDSTAVILFKPLPLGTMLYAAPPLAPQEQQVSGAADPVGSPAGEQTGPVSAAPTDAETAARVDGAEFAFWWGRYMPHAMQDEAWAAWCAIRSNAPPQAQPKPVSAADELAQLDPLIARGRALYEEWARAVERLMGQS